jgi:hypothetical protein
MLEQKRLRGDGEYTTWVEQLREGDQQVDNEDEEFPHGANRSMTVSARKTAPHRRIPSYYEFATHNMEFVGLVRLGALRRICAPICRHLIDRFDRFP